METLRSLEEALLDFPGAAIVISTIAGSWTAWRPTSWPCKGDSHIEFFEGNYTEYEADRKKRLGDAAAQPHRVRYRSWRNKSRCTTERSRKAPFCLSRSKLPEPIGLICGNAWRIEGRTLMQPPPQETDMTAFDPPC